MRKTVYLFKFFLVVCMLLLPINIQAYTRELWVGEEATCDASSAAMGLTSDMSWDVSGGYISVSGSGFYRTIRITQYFSGSATVTCSWNYKLFPNDRPQRQSVSWNFSCRDNPVSISPQNMTLNIGQTGDIFAHLSYNNAYSQYADLRFSSSSDKVSVSRNGTVKALKAGTAYVNVYSKVSSNAPYCIVTIKEPKPTGVSLPSTMSIDIDESRSLSAKILPEGATSDVTWWSDDSSIAKVSSSGVVTGMKAGSTKVWAKTSKGGYTDYCKVTVSEPLLRKVSSSPSDQEKDVSYQVHPSVQFNLPLFEGRAFSQISLKEDRTGERVQGKVSLDGKILYFVPTEDLQPSTTYVLTVPKNAVQNKWNTGLAEEVSVHFTTVVNPKDIKYFIVWDKQGGCVSFLLEERPRITYDLNNALIHCMTAKQDMDFSLKEVNKYTLDVVSDPQTGINQVVVDSKEKGDFSRQPNTLLLEHFNSGTLVRVYSLNGRLLQTYQVDGNGRLSISTQNWESGVYLIHTGSATYKIIKK